MTESYEVIEPSEPGLAPPPEPSGLVVVGPDPDALPGQPGYRGTELSERLREALAKRPPLKDDDATS